jgi:hypothetical protein
LLRSGAFAVKKCPDAPLSAMDGTGVDLADLLLGPTLDGETVAGGSVRSTGVADVLVFPSSSFLPTASRICHMPSPPLALSLLAVVSVAAELALALAGELHPARVWRLAAPLKQRTDHKG